jgi:hypothetical protein
MAEFFIWRGDDMALQRHRELLREAERNRLVRQALAGRERPQRFYCRALTWLGRRLVAWGWHLQARYGPAGAIAPLKVANGTR